MTTHGAPGRVALITGGASGIGLAVAALLQQRGWKLALLDLGEPALQAAAARIADGLLARRRRVFVPGWVRWLFVLRSALHTRPLEREPLAAAPELEALYLEDLEDGRVPGVAPPAP